MASFENTLYGNRIFFLKIQQKIKDSLCRSNVALTGVDC